MKDELKTMAARYEELVGKLRVRYRDALAIAVRQEVEFSKIVIQLRQANTRLEELLARLKGRQPVHARKGMQARSRKVPKSTTDMFARSKLEVTVAERHNVRRLA